MVTSQTGQCTLFRASPVCLPCSWPDFHTTLRGGPCHLTLHPGPFPTSLSVLTSAIGLQTTCGAALQQGPCPARWHLLSLLFAGVPRVWCYPTLSSFSFGESKPAAASLCELEHADSAGASALSPPGDPPLHHDNLFCHRSLPRQLPLLITRNNTRGCEEHSQENKANLCQPSPNRLVLPDVTVKLLTSHSPRSPPALRSRPAPSRPAAAGLSQPLPRQPGHGVRRQHGRGVPRPGPLPAGGRGRQRRRQRPRLKPQRHLLVRSAAQVGAGRCPPAQVRRVRSAGLAGGASRSCAPQRLAAEGHSSGLPVQPHGTAAAAGRGTEPSGVTTLRAPWPGGRRWLDPKGSGLFYSVIVTVSVQKSCSALRYPRLSAMVLPSLVCSWGSRKTGARAVCPRSLQPLSLYSQQWQ